MLLTHRHGNQKGFAHGLAKLEDRAHPRRLTYRAGHLWHDIAEHPPRVLRARIDPEFGDVLVGRRLITMLDYAKQDATSRIARINGRCSVQIPDLRSEEFNLQIP